MQVSWNCLRRFRFEHKKIFKGEIITPGIRLKGDSAGDQKIMGPKEAFKKGSTVYSW